MYLLNIYIIPRDIMRKFFLKQLDTIHRSFHSDQVMSERMKTTSHNTCGNEAAHTPYHAPKLINYGLVRNLTKGGTAAQPESMGKGGPIDPDDPSRNRT